MKFLIFSVLTLIYLFCWPFIFSILLFYRLTGRISGKNFIGKLGFYPLPQNTGKIHYWIHVSSLGEWNTLKKTVLHLEKELIKKDIHILITYFNQDMDSIKKKFPQFSFFFLPLENPHAFFYLVKHYRVRTLIVGETELWPILVLSMKALKVKMFLINATLFDQELKNYLRFKWLFRSVVNAFSIIFASSEPSQKNFVQLAGKETQIQFLGNLKLDPFSETTNKSLPSDSFANTTNTTTPADSLTTKYLGSRFRQSKSASQEKKKSTQISHTHTIVFASIHLDEVKCLKDTIKVIGDDPNYRFILVPREIKETDSIEKIIDPRMNSLVRISFLENHDDQNHENFRNKNFLWDHYGDLNEIYHHADLVVMGGTFIQFGGHNIIEPIFQNKPVLLGPHFFHFKEIVEIFRDNLIFSDSINLLTTIKKFFDDFKRNSKKDFGRKKINFFQGLSKKIAKQIIQEDLAY